MRRILLLSCPLLPLSKSPSFRLSTAITKPILTHQDLTDIESLSHQLCESGRLHDAVRLLDASILATPNQEHLSSLPIASVIETLSSSEDGLSPAMSLLTALRHNPNRSPSLLLCSNLLLRSYLRRRRYGEAWKVFAWFLGESESPCRPDGEMYRAAVRGFCGGGRAMEGVRALREMVRDGVEVDEEAKGLMWRSMIHEARIDEGREIDDALVVYGRGGDDDGKLGELLDRIIRDWEE